jgi:hypothetical protein
MCHSQSRPDNYPNGDPPLAGIRTLAAALRYASALLEQLPMKPWIAALVTSLVLGTIPLFLNVLLSVTRHLLDMHRGAFRTHTDAPVDPVLADQHLNPLEIL